MGFKRKITLSLTSYRVNNKIVKISLEPYIKIFNYLPTFEIVYKFEYSSIYLFLKSILIIS